MTPLKIAVAGASGRMGRMLVEAIAKAPDAVLAGALDVAGSPALGHRRRRLPRPAGRRGDRVRPGHGLAGARCLIDFTRPEGTLKHLAYCAEHGIAMVIGTTGFDDAGKAAIRAAAEKTAIVFAPNMSVGVNVTLKLLEMAAKSLAEGYDIEIIEAHHRHKVDAPSGTALKMGEVIADALGRDLKQCAVYGREGVTGERDPSTIGFATIRGGDIVGDHTVLFAGDGERIEISHKSSSRVTYAHGALRAARFLADKTTGLYDMQDVLALGRCKEITWPALKSTAPQSTAGTAFTPQCKAAFGFPESYSNTMDAWVDCLSYLRDADGMSKFRLKPNEVLEIVIKDAAAMREKAPDLLEELTFCVAGINERYEDYGEKPALALVLR